MKNPFKRGIVLLLAFMIAVIAPLVVLARPGAEDAGMERALIAVKGVIDVDDDVFTDFSYSSSYSNHQTREGLVWHFNWSAEKAHINASAKADGTLLEYSKYQSDGKNFGFAEVGKDEATANAAAFIKRAAPRLSGYYKAPEVVNTSLHSGEYNLSFVAEVNGRAFPAAQIGVSVNKFTGEVTRFSTRNVDPGRFEFERATDLISQSAAVDAYAEKIGLSLEYRSYFDFEARKLTVFAAYRFNSYGDRFIGARTGEVVEYVYDLGSDDEERSSGGSAPLMSESTADAAAPESQRSANITPAERAAIEQAAGFVTSEQALLKVLEGAELTNLDMTAFNDRYIGLNRDYYDNDRYIYNINMYRSFDGEAATGEVAGLFGRVDARTGRVLSFSFYYHGVPAASGTAMTDALAEAAADAFLKKMAPEELAKSKMEDRKPSGADPLGGRGSHYNFHYIRHENGVPFGDNWISVSINQNTGKVQSFTLNWFDNAVFPSVSNVLPQRLALEAFVDMNGSAISYITTGGGKAGIVYDFGGNRLVDPFSGKALDYSGKPSEEVAAAPQYGDVKGHWSERYVMQLLGNGVFLWGGKFEPDRVMTELEFLRYIMLIEPPYIARMDPQAYFSQKGVAVEVSDTKPVTRQEAARIIAEYLGFGKLAGQPQWFVYPFRDSVADEYKGYITICHMLGIMNGDADGRFNAVGNVTRAHAAVMLTNLVTCKV